MSNTTILTEGWEAAGHRVRAMLRHQLLALDACGLSAHGASPGDVSRDDAVAVSASPPQTSEAGARCVYRLSRFPSADRREPAQSFHQEQQDDVDPSTQSCSGGTALEPGDGSAARRVTFWPAVRHGLGQGETVSRDAIVVPSHWSRMRLLDAGVGPNRVAVVAPGVDGALFSPLSRAEREAVRANLGFDADETVLLHVSDGDEDAGTDLVLRSFARLRSAGLRVRLVLKADDPDVVPAYHELIRVAGADEDSLLRPETLAAVVTVPGQLDPQGWRLLYGMADAFVSPYRACAFQAPVLEALACGCPVVVTRGGATDDICDDDVAWRISGEVRSDAAGGCFVAPDLDELTDALADVSAGRGFDRLRFAQGRMRLLRAFTWERSARALAAALAGGAGNSTEAAPAANLLHGLPQPVDGRFAARPAGDLAAARRRARKHMTCPGPRDLTVVVQGPCLRISVEGGAPSIDEAVASIRRNFQGAQVVVSTWVGSDVDGLDADDVVLSPDPGSLDHPLHRPNNVNRMLTSTANGLAAATRPYCLKSRNDVLFTSDKLIRRPFAAAAPAVGFERRIWALASRIENSLRPYHPSDMVMFGRTDDLRRLWDVPPVTWADMFFPEPYGHIERMSSEQALFTRYLNGIGIDVVLDAACDGRLDVVTGSVSHMMASFDIFDEDEVDVIFSQRFRDHKIPSLCYTGRDFDLLREEFENDPAATCARIYAACQGTLNRVRRSDMVNA